MFAKKQVPKVEEEDYDDEDDKSDDDKKFFKPTTKTLAQTNNKNKPAPQP